jgi:hypothetical protein
MNYEQDNSFYFANNEPERVLKTSKHIKLINRGSYNKGPEEMSTRQNTIHKVNPIFSNPKELNFSRGLESKQFNITPSKMKAYVEEKDNAEEACFKFKFTSSDKKTRIDLYSHKSNKTKRNNENLDSIIINLDNSFMQTVGERNFFQVDCDKKQSFPIISSCSSDSSEADNGNLIRTFKSKAKIDIPLDKIDDEKFKIKELKKIRAPYFKDYKTLCKKDLKKKPVYNPLEYGLLYHSKKRKVSHSVKRIYSNEIPFYSEKEPVYFRIFNDTDIGFSKNWQKLIHELENDEDISSEDELINDASQHLQNELNDAIHKVCSDSDIVMNVNLLYN